MAYEAARRKATVQKEKDYCHERGTDEDDPGDHPLSAVRPVILRSTSRTAEQRLLTSSASGVLTIGPAEQGRCAVRDRLTT